MTKRLAFQVLITMLALGVGCDGGRNYRSVGEGEDRQLPGEDPLDGSTIDDGGMDGSGGGDGSTDGGDGSIPMDGSFLDLVDLPDG